MGIRFKGRFTPIGVLKIKHVMSFVPASPYWLNGDGFIGGFPENSSITYPLGAIDPNDNIIGFTITSGELPPGLEMNPFTGIISGIADPVESDVEFAFRVQVEDSTGNILIGNFSMQIINVTSTVTWITPMGNIGEPAPGESVLTQLEVVSK